LRVGGPPQKTRIDDLLEKNRSTLDNQGIRHTRTYIKILQICTCAYI
jgi:hypothetical protein